MKKLYKIDEISVGMSASYSQTITDTDVKQFAGISGDRNPVHMDEVYAENSRYKKRIAHGLLSSSFFSSLFGTQLPGEGCVYVGQNLNFKRPVYLGDTVTAIVTVKDIDVVRKRVFFNTVCTVKNKIVIDGTAELFMP
ncbi:MaoC family dehydratase [Francisella sp. Scap27]|uniref:MaoC family dehydratase n=1 Tax=Francisella sp. Scap27 TaxID=2589986 RepID=UPI0015B90A17|nr:MaoC family dehydratase [Francisella sp. Scap27]QLE78814.1 MaoC family dehydratase [Francisella sp. Scap27]